MDRKRKTRISSFCMSLLMVGCISLNAQNITLKEKNIPLKKVFSKIENASKYKIAYNNTLLNENERVSPNYVNKDVLEVLGGVLKGLGFSYKKEGNYLIVIPVNSPVRDKDTKNRKRVVTGRVRDKSTNEPLVGVSIRIKDTDAGTITDLNGNYSVEIPDRAEIEFSYIGYKRLVVNVEDLGVINVSLESDNEMLSEVVVIGAGTQKKASITGAISTVKGLTLKAPSSTLTNNLAGKLAGVVSMATSGEPGSGSEFYIRGISTFGGRATPLILLDGVEISSNDLDRLPAESIESFSILKDASATAIYGARGANGVMLVTTKSGEENSKARINVSFENSFVKPVNRVAFADGATWMEAYNQATIARSLKPVGEIELPYSQEVIDYTRAGINPYVYPDVDWYDLLFKEYTNNQRANINLQGGGSKVTYYMSLQANHDTGLLDVPKVNSLSNNINKWSYTFQNNIAYRVSSGTKLELRMNAQIGNDKGPGMSTTDIFNEAYLTNPVYFPAFFPSQDGDKHIRFGSREGHVTWDGSVPYRNPYAEMLASYKETNWNTLNTSVNLQQDLEFITKGLSATALVNFKGWSSSSYNRTMSIWRYRANMYTWDPEIPTQYELTQVGANGSDYINQTNAVKSTSSTFYFDARINYNRHFNNHNIGAMLMYMQREYREATLPNRNQGFSGRLTYDYMNKYLFEFNFGYNGTERLASGARFEFFPAASIGWVVSNESFWEPLASYIDFLKIRGSYGLVGSDETGTDAGASHFLYLNEVMMNQGYGYATGANGDLYYQGPQFNKYAVANAHWERVKKFDVGFDMSLFNQLSITFDYFHDQRDRILMKRGSFPNIMGYGNAIPWSNIGEVDNRGVEMSVSWTKEVVKDLTLDFRGTFTYNKNKYVYKDEPNYPYTWQIDKDKPLSHQNGYIAEGLFRDEEDVALSADQSGLGSAVMPGDIKYRDINGDGKISSEDQIMLSPYGNVPRIQYGFGLNIIYKKFDIGAFFNGSAQREIMINGIYPFCDEKYNNGPQNLMKFIADDYWSTENPNPNAKYPRLGIIKSQIDNNLVPSSFWLRNGNFLRFKTLEVGYTFPYCRVYLSGDNLIVWSPFKLWDPELSYNSYPLQRTFNLGIQVTF